MDGILNINKPSGKTSFNIVAMVKRLSGERRVGHAGTLDPIATGVLPVCLGRATRIVEFLTDETKVYRAEIELGVATDTYDATGKVIQTGDSSLVSRADLESVLASFRGQVRQTPPLYSAVKYQGRPLYELARAGIKVEPRSRLVRIDELELVDFKPPIATVEIVCGKGTYIRSLAHDLGQALGCGAYLKNLVRLRCGPFDIKDSVSVPEIESAFRYGYWPTLIYPVDSALWHWVAMVVGDDKAWGIRNGRSLLSLRGDGAVSRCRAYALDGCFLGVLRFNAERGEWHPEKVFYPA